MYLMNVGPAKSRNTRTMLERAKEIFDFIEQVGEPFPKSDLKNVNLSPAAAEKWLDLIVFIQKQPRIRLVKAGRTTIVEQVEQKFHVMSRETFMDPTKSIEERLHAADDFIKALFTSERLDYKSAETEEQFMNLEKHKRAKEKYLKSKEN